MTFIKHLKRLNSIDLLLTGYVIFTFFFILVFNSEISSSENHLLLRLPFLLMIVVLPLLDKFKTNNVFCFFRIAYPLVFLGFFYSETDALNNVFFQNLDYHFARYDSILFGFQPSLAFYKSLPQAWFSEMMNFSYFSYYFLIGGFSVYIYIKNRENFEKVVFCITCSFLIYYIIFIILPVSGPQYFFQPPHHQIADSGFFRKLVKFVECIGERPTAAFPSSHVGMVLILILLSWPHNIRLWFWLIPIFILLSFSTVYVKAHYAVDVAGGIITAPIILRSSEKIFTWIEKRDRNNNQCYGRGINC